MDNLFNQVDSPQSLSQISKVTDNNFIAYDESTGVGMYSVRLSNGNFVGHYILRTRDGKEIGKTKICECIFSCFNSHITLHLCELIGFSSYIPCTKCFNGSNTKWIS